MTPRTAWIVIDDGCLCGRFGPWRVRTPLTNITDAAITGPYRFVKTAGSARLGITDRGLTFATNGESGVLLRFARPVSAIDPLGLIRHPELTVTVREADRLMRAVQR